MQQQEEHLRRNPLSHQNYVSNITQMKYVAFFTIVLAIASGTIAWIYYFYFDRHLEFLLVGIIDFILIGLCIFDIYWSLSDEKDREEPNLTYPYIHQFGQQLLLAVRIGLFLCFLQYSRFNECLWLAPFQIAIIIAQLYLIHLGRIKHSRDFGIYRLLVYGSSLLIAMLLILAAYNLKRLIFQLNSQMLSLDHFSIQFMKFSLLAVLITTLIITILNSRRIRIYFVIAAFLVLGTMILTAMANGHIIRQAQNLHVKLSQSSGCRDAMQSIGEISLKEELDCQVKYLKMDEGPYLSCGQDEQSYKWEDKQYKLGCINTECCHKVKHFISHYVNNLTIWVNLIIAVGIVQALNGGMLSENTFESSKMSIKNDLGMLIIIFIFTIIAITIYNVTPEPALQVQNVMIKEKSVLNEVKVLQTPNYDKFQLQSRLNEFYNFQNCELANHFILTPIQFDAPSAMDQRDILLAIQAFQGSFVVKDGFNIKNLKFITTQDSVSRIFTQAIPNGVAHDEIIVQGPQTYVKQLLEKGLQFCSDNPLAYEFRVYSQLGTSPNSRLLAITNSVQTNVDSLFKYITIQGTIEDSDTFDPISDANVFVYSGGFLMTSCQVITTLYPHLLHDSSDEKGHIQLNNLNKGMEYTILVKKEGFKHACLLVDLAKENPKLKYHIRMTPQISKYSMKIMLEWSSDKLNLDLYGKYTVNSFQCMTGAISKGCGGMHIHSKDSGDQHIETLIINDIEPYEYLFFVKRFLTREQALEKATQENVNKEWIEADPSLTVYVPEVEYPIIQYRIRSFTQTTNNIVDLTWKVFKLNGAEGDGPKNINTYWSDISNQEITSKLAKNKDYWPS